MSDTTLEMAADIVAAYVSNNNLPESELPELIAAVHRAVAQLTGAAAAPAPVAAPAEKPAPAVPVRKSIHDDHLVCLEDGKSFKSLKRHLRTDHNLSPEDYRARWGLPADYPMVAPNYAAARSELAKKMGLGRKPGQSLRGPRKGR